MLSAIDSTIFNCTVVVSLSIISISVVMYKRTENYKNRASVYISATNRPTADGTLDCITLVISTYLSDTTLIAKLKVSNQCLNEMCPYNCLDLTGLDIMLNPVNSFCAVQCGSRLAHRLWLALLLDLLLTRRALIRVQTSTKANHKPLITLVIIYGDGCKILHSPLAHNDKNSIKHSWIWIVIPISTKIKRFFLLVKHLTPQNVIILSNQQYHKTALSHNVKNSLKFSCYLHSDPYQHRNVNICCQ